MLNPLIGINDLFAMIFLRENGTKMYVVYISEFINIWLFAMSSSNTSPSDLYVPNPGS